jgi:hypothetical protein
MLANAAMHFVPILLSLPWTLFRIGFFMAVDQDNRDFVRVLMWCTMSSLPRLSLLPATMAYVYNPDSLIVDWYAIFLVATIGLMVCIHATGRKGLGWYFLWGWVFFLLPLLMMATVALQEALGSLLLRMWRSLWEDWSTFLAEFTLSDVVISDAFFLLRRSSEGVQKSEPLDRESETALRNETDDTEVQSPTSRISESDLKNLGVADPGCRGCSIPSHLGLLK